MLTFADLNLSPPIQKAILELGFEKPSPIQEQALPILLGEPTDFIGLAATGTGKTAAFGIPMLERIDGDIKGVQALILCPTRELAGQVSGQIKILGKYKGVNAVAVYGGASFGDQVYGLKSGAAVVVGTPGRVIDHLNRGTLKLDGVKVLILDEADEMISMGFKDELEAILKMVPRAESKIWLFSATMSREVRRVADTYLKQPKQVQVNRKEMLSETVEQYYYVTQESNKPEILCKLIDNATDFYGLIFCQTKSLVNDLAQYMSGRGYKVDCLHGDKEQRDRERTMQNFRDRRVQMLICTDVAARGLDVKDVTHVVNYSIPRELDSYVHRIGRTARSGKAGVAMSLVTPANRRLVERIEFMTKSKMIQGKIPSSKEVGMKKVSALLPKFAAQMRVERVAELVDPTWMSAVEEMSKSEIIGRFVSMIMPDILEAPQRQTFNEPVERQPKYQSRDGGGGGGRSRFGRDRFERRPRGGYDRDRAAPKFDPTPRGLDSGSRSHERALAPVSPQRPGLTERPQRSADGPRSPLRNPRRV